MSATINAAPPVQRLAASAPANRTGMPDDLKAGIEHLSGLSMDHVKVHRNSAKPAKLNARAYAQGSAIHLGPGEERHLPHEAWHLVQQAKGRVRPTMQLKGGTPVNDDKGLEREADLMGARAIAAGRSAAPIADAAPLQGHTIPSSAPVQRVIWQWSATNNSWSAVGSSSSTSAPPSRPGKNDGELFDDQTYNQAKDPTVKPFLHSGEKQMGERGAKQQLGGKKPRPDDIRVTAVKTPDLKSGSGLHEILPTNMLGEVASSGNPSLVGFQSGGRTSTAQQLFNIGSNEVGAHTGFAPKPTGKGFTHTQGQGPSHDKLRETAKALYKQPDPDIVNNEMMLKHLEITPHGQQVMSSSYLKDMQPSRKSIGTIGPVVSTGTPDPSRIALAKEAQRGRESTKRRVRTHKRATGKGRSPSPPRAPIDDQGGGGGYIPSPSTFDEIEPFPDMPQGSNFEYSSNLSSWMTQPQREGFPSAPPISTSTTVSSANPVNNNNAVTTSLTPPILTPPSITAPLTTSLAPPILTPPSITAPITPIATSVLPISTTPITTSSLPIPGPIGIKKPKKRKNSK